MTSGQMPSRPIGWWLKQADAHLDAAFDRSLEGRPVDRRGWQVLASLAKCPTSRSELVASLAIFDSPSAVDAVVRDLRSRGWVEESAGVLRLTSNGELEHAALAPLVAGVRARVAEALPQDDYVTLVQLLQRLVEAV
ncbi:MAG: MarR family transcriptional regulator [Pseudonocardiales bacterium]|nr:MAG: MarR family transcriptional regulator [Pseudonocardiales bacterium]